MRLPDLYILYVTITNVSTKLKTFVRNSYINLSIWTYGMVKNKVITKPTNISKSDKKSFPKANSGINKSLFNDLTVEVISKTTK